MSAFTICHDLTIDVDLAKPGMPVRMFGRFVTLIGIDKRAEGFVAVWDAGDAGQWVTAANPARHNSDRFFTVTFTGGEIP